MQYRIKVRRKGKSKLLKSKDRRGKLKFCTREKEKSKTRK